MSDDLKRVFGIDLGTTYSAIAYVDEHGKPAIVPNGESERITPSVVLFDGDRVIVGNTAKESAKVEPDRVVSRVKQHMGDPNYLFACDGRTYTPEEISSLILRKVVGDAEQALGGEPITDVVITCPAYFGTSEREATANAGRLAGLNVRSVLNEPTAAALAYGLEQREDQRVLVYDLGGGTFDVTLIEIRDKLIRVICTGGDHRLGGALWDEAIVLDLAQQFRDQTGLEDQDPMDDPEVLNSLFLDAERGKKTLSQRDRVPFRVTHGGQQARIELTRARFDELTAHLLDRTIELTRDLLAEARSKGVERFDKLILVGGATRMPQIARRLHEEFGIEPESYDPDESVAKGAALFGLRESLHEEVQRRVEPTAPAGPGTARPLNLGEIDEAELQRALDEIERATGYTLTDPVRELVSTQVVNVLSRALGVVARNETGAFEVVFLLPRNGEVPMLRTTDFGTDVAHQDAVEIKVMAGQGSSKDPADSAEVGTAVLSLPGNLPPRSPIRVQFAISRDGRLTVTATDLTGGGTIDVEFATEAVLSADQVAERSTALSALDVS